MEYYVYINQNRLGPYSMEQIDILNLPLDTPVWYDGLTDWTTIGELKNLAEKPNDRFYNHQSQKTEETVVRPPKSEDLKQRRSLGYLLAVALVIIVLIIGFTYTQLNSQESGLEVDSIAAGGSSEPQNIPNAEQQVDPNNSVIDEEMSSTNEDPAKTFRDNWVDYVVSGNNQYLYSDLGGISQLEISVSNNSPYKLDEVVVLVSYIKVNGDIYKNETINFYDVEPNTQVNLPAPDSPRGVRIEHSIMNVQSASMGLHFPH